MKIKITNSGKEIEFSLTGDSASKFHMDLKNCLANPGTFLHYNNNNSVLVLPSELLKNSSIEILIDRNEEVKFE
ncbi:hypothetical protein C1637_14510 [Chryseobacterium lactis]|uniref:Cyclophilin-like domain-containing protein n=1 Tax=Chryseobacterium lactis TaxID=1241981 RepID=A0A3G6RG82_CHRLC|nr:hypothetical protein [Chryseobacterium lactis]AZA83666.1 hypothetical protein EG342_18055 [Chryseobacterium lactis]AZB04051.1 hypothetical protein EG341_08930 [Chryseobacterium lactis]PNW13040.1 hypothetical protein C1637_14510 [Chryseobacterium lactis]